jgi:hypothetical protein
VAEGECDPPVFEEGRPTRPHLGLFIGFGDDDHASPREPGGVPSESDGWFYAGCGTPA